MHKKSVKELKEICKIVNINLKKSNGTRKLKKELVQELNKKILKKKLENMKKKKINNKIIKGGANMQPTIDYKLYSSSFFSIHYKRDFRRNLPKKVTGTPYEYDYDLAKIGVIITVSNIPTNSVYFKLSRHEKKNYDVNKTISEYPTYMNLLNYKIVNQNLAAIQFIDIFDESDQINTDYIYEFRYMNEYATMYSDSALISTNTNDKFKNQLIPISRPYIPQYYRKKPPAFEKKELVEEFDIESYMEQQEQQEKNHKQMATKLIKYFKYISDLNISWVV